MSTTASPGEANGAEAGSKLRDFASKLQQKLDQSAHAGATGEDSFGAFATADRGEKYDKEQFVLFFLREQPYALPIQSVIEIIRPLAVTPLPNVAVGIEGLVNLRGRTLPIIDLGIWLQLDLEEQETSSSGARIIVYQAENEQVGFIVDQVAEVIGFTSGEIEKPSDLGESVQSAVVRGHAQYQGFVVTLLDSIEVAA